MKTKTILIPTDFSANAQNAVNYAISMFDGEKINFLLLNSYRIIPLGSAEYITNTDMSDYKTYSEQGLKQVLKSIKKTFPDKELNIETMSKLGYPVQEMDKIVKRKNVDLVVMGTKGASGIKEILIGSNTADAIKNLTCPVLAVPENASCKNPKNIAFAADFGDIEKPVLLNPMLEIAKKIKAEILVVHVDENGKKHNTEEAYQEMKLNEMFADIPHLFSEIKNSNPAQGIEDFVKTRAVDMLVTVARKHSFIHNLLRGSVTGKLAMHTHIPLLALQYK